MNSPGSATIYLLYCGYTLQRKAPDYLGHHLCPTGHPSILLLLQFRLCPSSISKPNLARRKGEKVESSGLRDDRLVDPEPYLSKPGRHRRQWPRTTYSSLLYLPGSAVCIPISHHESSGNIRSAQMWSCLWANVYSTQASVQRELSCVL